MNLQLSFGGKRGNQSDIQRSFNARNRARNYAGVVPSLDDELLRGHLLEVDAVLRARN